MNSKTTSIYFAILAVLYFGYTVFIAGHGIHWTNTVITVTVMALAVYYHLKGRTGR